MDELARRIGKLEESRDRLGKRSPPLVAAALAIIAVAALALVSSSGAFPATGSHVCEVLGQKYYVLDGSYFTVTGENLVAVSQGKEIVGTESGDWTVGDAHMDYTRWAPIGARCAESGEPARVIAAANANGSLVIEGHSYPTRGFGKLPEDWHEGQDLN